MSRTGDSTRRLGGGLALAMVLVPVATGCRQEEDQGPAPSQIAFFAEHDGEYALYAIRSDGRGLTRIADRRRAQSPDPPRHPGLPATSCSDCGGFMDADGPRPSALSLLGSQRSDLRIHH